MAREQDMHRLTVDGVTYCFRSDDDFRLARDLMQRIATTRTQFQAELNRRWIRYVIEDRPHADIR
jgi:hypothetical protein